MRPAGNLACLLRRERASASSTNHGTQDRCKAVAARHKRFCPVHPRASGERRAIADGSTLRTSYAAGRHAQLTDPDLLASRPYWRYVHSGLALDPRPDHLAWGASGLTLPHDHPFWATHYPPNGWGCRCRVVAVPAPREGDRTVPPAGWDRAQPPGVDKGWAYAPGATVSEELRAMVAQKVEKLPPALGHALAEDASNVLKPAKAFEEQPTAKAAADWAVANDLADHADYAGISAEVANAWAGRVARAVG